MSGLLITGLGAVTSVGMDAVTTCASIRAGISRPAPLESIRVLDLEDYKEVSITGHPAGAIARGFSNVGRWLQLAPVALADLCSNQALPSPKRDPTFWARTKCLVALPFLDQRFEPDPYCTNDMIDGAFSAPLASRVQQFFGPSGTYVHARGRTGVLESIVAAGPLIRRGETDRVVLVVVDSLVDTPALEWLLEYNRIKCDENPIGLSPGEAACAFMLEDAAAAKARGAAMAVSVRAIATANEAKAFLANELGQGEALATVISRVLSDVGVMFQGTVVADLNGEKWRAYEFGCARARFLGACGMPMH